MHTRVHMLVFLVPHPSPVSLVKPAALRPRSTIVSCKAACELSSPNFHTSHLNHKTSQPHKKIKNRSSSDLDFAPTPRCSSYACAAHQPTSRAAQQQHLAWPRPFALAPGEPAAVLVCCVVVAVCRGVLGASTTTRGCGAIVAELSHQHVGMAAPAAQCIAQCTSHTTHRLTPPPPLPLLSVPCSTCHTQHPQQQQPQECVLQQQQHQHGLHSLSSSVCAWQCGRPHAGSAVGPADC